MKFLMLLPLVLMSMMHITAVQAAEKDKVVLHINNPQKMTMLVNNVTNLRSRLGPDADIVVVVNGPAVVRFTNLTPSRKPLDKLLKKGAEVQICSYALKNKKINRIQLLEGTNYLEDGGVAKLVDLQKKGYAYIKP